jgi:hypothetical protein
MRRNAVRRLSSPLREREARMTRQAAKIQEVLDYCKAHADDENETRLIAWVEEKFSEFGLIPWHVGPYTTTQTEARRRSENLHAEAIRQGVA